MSIKSKFFTKWGTNALKVNDTELALKMINKAIKADSRELKAYLTKIAILSRMGQPKEALETLDLAIETNPENKEIDNLREMRQPLVEYINETKNAEMGEECDC